MVPTPLRYKLVGTIPVPCDSIEWTVENGIGARVAQTQVGPLWVSTVFLGIDHSMGLGPPLLFETMLFDDGADSYQERCTTWAEAEQQHAAAVAEAERRLAAAKASLPEFTREPSGGGRAS